MISFIFDIFYFYTSLKFYSMSQDTGKKSSNGFRDMSVKHFRTSPSLVLCHGLCPQIFRRTEQAISQKGKIV